MMGDSGNSTWYEKGLFCVLLLGLLVGALFFADYFLTRPMLLGKRILLRGGTIAESFHARDWRAEGASVILTDVTIGDVPAAQIKLTFEPHFPGLIRVKEAEIAGAELRVDPVLGELNGKTIPAFLENLRESLPMQLLPKTPHQRLMANGYLDSGSRSGKFHFESRRLEKETKLEFRSDFCRVEGNFGEKSGVLSAVFSGSGSLISPLPGALPKGAVLSGDAEWRWSLSRDNGGAQKSSLSGRLGADGGTILLQDAAVRFAPGSQIDFQCDGDRFSGALSQGTLLVRRVELKNLSFQSRQEGGMTFAGVVRLAHIPGIRRGSLPKPMPAKGYFDPQDDLLHVEAVMEKTSPDIFLPLASFLPGKSMPEKLLWTLNKYKGKGSFRVECAFDVMHFEQKNLAEKAKLTLESQLHSTRSGYILPESRLELSAGHFRIPGCDLQNLVLCRTTRGGNTSYELNIGAGNFDADRNGSFVIQDGKVAFQEEKGIVNGTLGAKELRQKADKNGWSAREPLFSFRYEPKTGGLSLGGRAAGLRGPQYGLQAEDCTLEVSSGKTGWEGTLQASSLRRLAGEALLKLRNVQIHRTAGLMLLRAGGVDGRWREADFTGENFQLNNSGEFRCDKIQFKLAQSWEGKCTAVERTPELLHCSGLSLHSIAQKKEESLALSEADLSLQNGNGTLRIGHIAAPGNWRGSARLSAERTEEGLRFFGNLLAAPSNDTLALSGSIRLAEKGAGRIRVAFRRAPRELPAALSLTPSGDGNVKLIVRGRTGISGEYRFADRSFAGDVTYQLLSASLAMEQDFIRLEGVKTDLSTDFSTGKMKDGIVSMRFAGGTLGQALHTGAGEGKLQVRDQKLFLRDLQVMAMGGTIQMDQALLCNGTPHHQMYFTAATIRPSELAGGGFALRCDGEFRVGDGEFGCTLKGGNGSIRLGALAPFANQEKNTLNAFVQAALVDFSAKTLQLDYLGRANGSGKMRIAATGSPAKPIPFAFDEVRQKFDRTEPGEPGFLGEVDLAVDYTFPAGVEAERK